MTDARARSVWLVLGSGLVVAVGLGIWLGSVSLRPMGVLASLVSAIGLDGLAPNPLDETGETILFTVRLPRVLLAALVGGGLAVVGAALQALFRNPMADAGLLGVGAGAAFGAVLAVNLGWAAERYLALPLSAFAGALVAVLALHVIAHASGRPSLQGLLLTGLAIGALASAGTSVFLVATEEFRVKTVLFWLAGGLEGRSWDHLRLAALFVGSGCLGLLLMSRPLDLLSLGEDEASALGLPVHAARLGVLVLASLVAGAATSVAGSVPFVGLIAPHALRPFVGPRSHRLIPAAFIGGALLVVTADLLARTASVRFELPLGSLTAFVGAPYFLLALRANEGRL